MKKTSSVITSLDFQTMLEKMVSIGLGIWNMKSLKDLSYRHIAVVAIVVMIYAALCVIMAIVKNREDKRKACAINSGATKTHKGKEVSFNISVTIDACEEELKKGSVEALERAIDQILQTNQEAVFAAARACIKNEEVKSKKSKGHTGSKKK